MPGPAWLSSFPSEAMLYALHTDGSSLTSQPQASAHRWLSLNIKKVNGPDTSCDVTIEFDRRAAAAWS